MGDDEGTRKVYKPWYSTQNRQFWEPTQVLPRFLKYLNASLTVLRDKGNYAALLPVDWDNKHLNPHCPGQRLFQSPLSWTQTELNPHCPDQRQFGSQLSETARIRIPMDWDSEDLDPHCTRQREFKSKLSMTAGIWILVLNNADQNLNCPWQIEFNPTVNLQYIIIYQHLRKLNQEISSPDGMNN